MFPWWLMFIDGWTEGIWWVPLLGDGFDVVVAIIGGCRVYSSPYRHLQSIDPLRIAPPLSRSLKPIVSTSDPKAIPIEILRTREGSHFSSSDDRVEEI